VKKRKNSKIGRNDTCPCGSGLKYKKCCLPKGMDGYGTRIQHQTVPVVLPGTRVEIASSIIFQGKRLRFIWNRLYWFEAKQTFHEFLNYVAIQTLGVEWFKKQHSLPAGEQHVVIRWHKTLRESLRQPPQTADGAWLMTGPLKAYFCLAYDLYWLELRNKLPSSPW